MLFSVRRFILQLFVCIIFDKHKFSIRAHSIKNNKIAQTYERSFNDRTKALEYINALRKNFQVYYQAILYPYVAQGLVPTDKEAELKKFGINAENIKTIRVENAQFYAATKDLQDLQNEFKPYGGLDFIFSPFAILHFLITKEKLANDKISLCVYRHSDLVAMMICRGREVLFGNFFDIAPKISSFANQSSVPLENIAEASDLSNADDLQFDNLESMLDEKLDDIQYTNSNDDLSNFGNDMQMSICIFQGVQEFYANDLYKGNFIDEMIIFDDENTSEAALEYIEGEIFLKPRHIQVDSLDIMSEMMQKELL